MSFPVRATPGNPLTVSNRTRGIQEEPNLSACPGRIDGHKQDTFQQVDPDLSLTKPKTTKVEQY